MTIVYILIAILIFGVLIIIHELGHFAAAKACGVRVEEFAVGMGPAIFKKQKGETTYSLRCIPFGGFCAMTGEDEESKDPRAFKNQAAGDRFYSIDGHRIYQYYDVSDFISKGDGSYDIIVIRDGKKVKLEDFELVPLEYEGYENKMYGFLFGVEEATIGAKIENTWNTCMEFVRMVWMGLSELVSGNVGVKDMAGPVGIVDMMAQTGEQAESVSDALSSIFYFGAFIAVNLAVMNMLPIPALDGGRVFLLIITCIIEVITRKKLNPKYEGYIHAAGMVLLLALMVYVMFNDIIRIVTG